MAGTDDPENVTLAPNDSEYFYWAANVIFAYQRYLSDNDKSADIAIVELDKPLDFSEKINAICLAREFREALGEVQWDRNDEADRKHNRITSPINHPEEMICAGGFIRNVWSVRL
ncbi:hypothetical protein AAVH_07202 [Aphelenchoides avenae]|nr:hypothetical protein AAVH_07202 [Aphelenchus avenae]